MQSLLRQGKNSVSRLVVHLVFATKYRRKLFKGMTLDRMGESAAKVARKMDVHLLELEGEPEPVHHLVE